MKGRLVLVATPIGNLDDLSPRAVATLRDADVVAAEDTRRTRALLTHSGVPAGRRLRAVHAHNEADAAARIAAEVTAGRVVAYVTDAGMPGISDPGARLARACLDAGLAVEVVPGPSAPLAALVLSGLPTERFAFEGFLPRRGAERSRRLGELATTERTVILLEAPGRVAATLAALSDACGAERPVAVARELTKVHEEVWRGPVGHAAERWKDRSRKGEHVIVVGPAAHRDAVVDDTTLDAALDGALARGASARDAAAAAAGALGVPRRRAYERAVARRRSP